jgi:hypothetical protein
MSVAEIKGIGELQSTCHIFIAIASAAVRAAQLD